jgi:halocyanin-like protein
MVPQPSRRRLLATAALTIAGTVAGCTQAQSSADEGAPADSTTEPPTESPTEPTESGKPATTTTAAETVPYFEGWMADARGYDYAVADYRGESEVTVAVGAPHDDGHFAFAPPVVQVDPGTTVRWEWTGDGGAHNVVAEDDGFDSGDPVLEPGQHFATTVEEAGIYRYSCLPHRGLGMKGVVVVGDDYPTRPASEVDRSEPDEGTPAHVGHDHDDETPTPTDGPYGGYLAGASNFDGTPADRTDADEVVVTVGSQANGGGFGFTPAAVEVTPGTTVRWRWTGNGGAHNVVAEDGAFDSDDVVAEPGVHFEYTVEETGVHRYYCAPHKALGMKGVVDVVED